MENVLITNFANGYIVIISIKLTIEGTFWTLIIGTTWVELLVTSKTTNFFKNTLELTISGELFTN